MWYDVVGVVDFANDSGAVYIDGISQAIDAMPSFTNTATPNTSSDNAAIGAEEDGTGGYTDGRIDEVRISTVARTADWIAASHLSQNGTFAFNNFGSEEASSTLVIIARETVDSDGNGQIDQIKITTNLNLDDDFAGLTIAVSGYTVSLDWS